MSNFDDHSNQLDCQLLLVEHFPSGIYIDPDQIKNEVEFGGPEVRFNSKLRPLPVSFIGTLLLNECKQSLRDRLHIITKHERPWGMRTTV